MIPTVTNAAGVLAMAAPPDQAVGEIVGLGDGSAFAARQDVTCRVDDLFVLAGVV